MSDKLIPPDHKQCQCEKPNGARFMSFGDVPRLVRCVNKPNVIVTERKALSADGYKGSMSLCRDCYAEMQKQLGPNYATVKLL